MSLNLFSDDIYTDESSTKDDFPKSTNLQALAQIDGLEYHPNFITTDHESELLNFIDVIHCDSWLTDLQRRVQHYGYKYDYKSRRIDLSMQLGELPSWLVSLGKRLVRQEVFVELPDQVIINEYLPGQGISRHIDCVPCFEETIASLSIGSTCMMEFIDPVNNVKVPIFLEPRSLVVMKKEARYKWQHSIPARNTDTFLGITSQRKRRISLTFRRVILDESSSKIIQSDTNFASLYSPHH